MNPARVNQRGLAVISCRSGWLEGFGLRFNKVSAAHAGSGHANIVWAPNERVEGVLYELSDANQIKLMDPFEAAPWNYGRDALWVISAQSPGESNGGPQSLTPAWTYFANPAVQQLGLAPSQDYLDHLLAGRAFLSGAYYQGLANTPTSQGV